MADAIDQTDSAVGTADEVDTTTDEESIESSMEEVSWDDGDKDESEVEDESEAATEEDTDTEEESTDDVESEDSDQETEEDSTTSKDDEEARKRHNQEMAQRRIQEREAKQKAQLEDQQKYLADAEDATDQALRQLQVDAYNNRIMMVTNQVRSDIITARDSIDLFNHENPVIREAMLKAVDDFETYHVQKDEYGNMTGIQGDVQQYLHAKAEEIRQLTGIGKQEQVKAKQQQNRRTTAPPAKSPPKAKVDPDLEAFDAEASSW